MAWCGCLRATNSCLKSWSMPCPPPPQAAYLLGNQGAVDADSNDVSNASHYGNVFWTSLPPGQGWLYSMLIIGYSAAVVASQAIISGSYSIISQVSRQ